MVRLLVLGLVLGVAAPLGGMGCSDCDLQVTTPFLPDGTVGQNYSFRLDSDCGGDAWFLEGGTLPPGISLLEDGTLRGVPTLEGTFNFTVGIADFDDSERAFKGFAITVT